MTQFNYDLEERTAKFGEEVVVFARSLKIDPVNARILDQLIGAVGSTGANYCEAVEAESRKDFIHKISICKKEVREARHWLRLLARAHPERKAEILKFSKEAHELLLIFAKIVRSARSNQLNNSPID
ncbi:MAG: four helix bundle protein [Candidatus Liptonbacteria bacterium]|nr:four helix bundle protein [Candidatus Liptonbacteria bacterium]